MNRQQHLLSRNIVALMYHRIDIRDTDPWGICVSPEHFEEQIRWLKNNCNVITVQDIIDSLNTGHIPENSVCITFDDGYADNYCYAKPILEKWKCPAAFFIATSFIDSPVSFWWDELEMILLHTKRLPLQLLLFISGEEKSYRINEKELTDEMWKQHSNWKWYEEPPTSRCALFLSIWEASRVLPCNEIKKQMRVIRIWANGNDLYSSKRLPMTRQQLRELSANPLFTTGIHTHTHPDLSAAEYDIQKEEIMYCAQALKQEFNIESRCMAYPYGRYTDVTLRAAKECGINIAFTTEATTINTGSHSLTCGRFQAGDWDADTFAKHFAEWRKR